tara:strand:+ start:1133 stop:2038 length:906 start_codon:yes stop_codon:yes gene_type:complete
VSFKSTINRQDILLRYQSGENISRLLRDEEGNNTEGIVELAYDLQSGSYIEALNDPEVLQFKRDYGKLIASTIREFCEPGSILEAGVGEATTLAFVLQVLTETISFGFDISWSRIWVAKQWIQSQNIAKDTSLFTASIFAIPLPDNSIDVVYTSHSIEPNGGMEEAAVKELYRVARKYVILLEPAYDLASLEAKERMKSHGYCVHLFDVIQQLGLPVERHELFPLTISSMNPTGVTIIRKPAEEALMPKFVCPVTGGILTEFGGALHSHQHLAAYPIIGGIPCLRDESSVLASAISSFPKL